MGASSKFTRGFHLRRDAREAFEIDAELFSFRGDVVFATHADARRVAHALKGVTAAEMFGMGVLHEMQHALLEWASVKVSRNLRIEMVHRVKAKLGPRYRPLLLSMLEAFPPPLVYRGEMTAEAFLDAAVDGTSAEEFVLEELLLLSLANENPAYHSIKKLISDAELHANDAYLGAVAEIAEALGKMPVAVEAQEGTAPLTLYQLLTGPMHASPDSIAGQLRLAREGWAFALSGTAAFSRIASGEALLREDARWAERPGGGGGAPPPSVLGVGHLEAARRFSEDKEWMPKVVLIAKSTFVWLDQLSRTYQRPIHTLADIPDEELRVLASRGFNSLWLIGVWKRSEASRTIKQRMGNPNAAPSAYALHSYDIADDLGGEAAYENLRDRAARVGIRLASDMVPNHMGIDSDWVERHPDWFIQTSRVPFPSHTFNGPDLGRGDVSIYIEDGYWRRSDAAPEFMRVDRRTGEARFVYHGNDGTSLPWNDTAQLDLLKPEVREALIQTILHVARKFPIVRFDAAMTYAKQHVQRLWYPKPGADGGIPSRSDFALPEHEFDARMPREFWVEVVDRVAKEAPDTLLLAEAFWMMEGYFVRTLGMHRVYNSAFMNMMKTEDNAGYRRIMKEVIAYDPEILCRFVNFMNNPDEEPAAIQFGKGEKYFGVCTLLATLPGLPMFGHGQLEGFAEKYGMEFLRANWDEAIDFGLLEHHERVISPLLKKRALFSGVAHFRLFDFIDEHGHVDESVYAYTNEYQGEKSLVVYKNGNGERRRGVLRYAAPLPNGTRTHISEALGIEASRPRVLVMQNPNSPEQASWASGDVLRDGLPIEIGGFETLVFLNIREEDDHPEPPSRNLPVRDPSPFPSQMRLLAAAFPLVMRAGEPSRWVAEVFVDREVIVLLGMHEFGGHRYFLREPFESLVLVEAMLRTLTAPARSLEIREKAYELLMRAEKCGYRADLFWETSL